MTGRGSDYSSDEQRKGANAARKEGEGDACEAGGCCGIAAGRGGKLRVALLVVLAVVIVVLLVHGFSTAG